MEAEDWSREFLDIWNEPSDLDRAANLVGRLPFLSDREKEESLYRVLQFEDPYSRLQAFRALIQELSPEQLPQAASIAQGTSDPALVALAANRLSGPEQAELVREAWSLLRELTDSHQQWDALEPLLSLLPESLKEPALRIIREFSDPALRSEALAMIADTLDGRQRSEALADALKDARALIDFSMRTRALCIVAPRLSEPVRGEIIGEALKSAREIHLEAHDRAERLIDVAELLPEDDREALYREALDTIRVRLDDRADQLLHLAERFPRSFDQDLLKIAEGLDDESERSDVLLRLHGQFEGPELKVAEPVGKPDEAKQVAVESNVEAEFEPTDEQAQSPGTSETIVEDTQPGEEPTARPDQDIAVPIHSDVPARFDELNRAPFANVLATAMQEVWEGRDSNSSDDIGAPGDAFIIHIHGPWGAGKSSVLNFLRDRLRQGVSLPNEERPRDPWVVIWFNAWRHQRINPPWLALIQAIYRQGREQVGKGTRLRLFFRNFGWRLRTGAAPYILAGAVLLWLISVAVGLPQTSDERPAEVPAPTEQTSDAAGTAEPDGTSAVATREPSGNLATEAGTLVKAAAENSKDLLELLAILLAVWGLLLGGFRALMFGSADTATKFMELSHDPMQPVVRHFRNLVEAFRRPVAIFIDDLDRCDKEYVLEALRGMQTLFHEAKVTYVIAADREWVRASYESAYTEFAGSVRAPGRPLGYLFLDKLFQVSVCIPRLSPAKQEEYLQCLVQDGAGRDEAALAKAEEDAEAEAERELGTQYKHNEMLGRIRQETDVVRRRALQAVAARRFVSGKARRATEHVLQEFAPMLEANPRAMKRLVNAYGFNRSTSVLADQDLDVGPLARWTIVEMRWPLLARHLEQFPDLADSIGVTNAPVADASDLAELFRDAEVIEVMRGPTSGNAAILDTKSLRQILGST